MAKKAKARGRFNNDSVINAKRRAAVAHNKPKKVVDLHVWSPEDDERLLDGWLAGWAIQEGKKTFLSEYGWASPDKITRRLRKLCTKYKEPNRPEAAQVVYRPTGERKSREKEDFNDRDRDVYDWAMSPDGKKNGANTPEYIALLLCRPVSQVKRNYFPRRKTLFGDVAETIAE